MKIEVDWGLCESNGVCMGVLPEVFQLGDDDMLTVLQPDVTPRERGAGARSGSSMPPAGDLDRGVAISHSSKASRIRRG